MSKTHSRFNRARSPALLESELGHGGLEPGCVYEHGDPNCYFVSANTAHSVKPCRRDRDGDIIPVVTMYIRGVDKKRDTIMLSPQKDPDWGGKNRKEYELFGAERNTTLDEIASLVLKAKHRFGA